MKEKEQTGYLAFGVIWTGFIESTLLKFETKQNTIKI
jgi:hypothetical protein